jgi:hypothetical protein
MGEGNNLRQRAKADVGGAHLRRERAHERDAEPKTKEEKRKEEE